MSPCRFTMLVLIAACVCLAGCESSFNKRNFEMIQAGFDDRFDVREILGDPDGDMGDVWVYDDLDRHYAARIFFDGDGRVLSKQWMDAKTGEWEGEDPWGDRAPEGEVRERSTKTRRIDDD